MYMYNLIKVIYVFMLNFLLINNYCIHELKIILNIYPILNEYMYIV